MHHELDAARLNAFGERLRRSKRRWVETQFLWSAFAAAFPTFAVSAERRRWFLAALTELSRQQIVELPTAKGNRWDRSLDPAVPRAVALVRAQELPKPNNWKTFPWHSRLRWVGDLPRLSEETEAFLRRIHQGLVRDEFQTRAPLKYRSLQLTGREKRLGELVQSSLFGEGRLTLELLGCFSETPPLAYDRVADLPSIILFENADSFSVARNVLHSMTNPPYGMVGFGGGNGISRSLPSLVSLPTPVREIFYVGDFDVPGLRIAARAARTASQSGLPSVQPATVLHRAMLESAKRFGNPEGWKDLAPSRLPGDRLATLLDFLEPALRNSVSIMLNKGNRIPEEVLGPQELLMVWG